MSSVDRQLRALDQHNPLIPALLGMVSLLNQLDVLLDGTTEETQPQDALLDAALGLFAVRSALRGWLATIDDLPAPAATTAHPPEDLLR